LANAINSSIGSLASLKYTHTHAPAENVCAWPNHHSHSPPTDLSLPSAHAAQAAQGHSSKSCRPGRCFEHAVTRHYQAHTRAKHARPISRPTMADGVHTSAQCVLGPLKALPPRSALPLTRAPPSRRRISELITVRRSTSQSRPLRRSPWRCPWRSRAHPSPSGPRSP